MVIMRDAFSILPSHDCYMDTSLVHHSIKIIIFRLKRLPKVPEYDEMRPDMITSL